MHDKPSEPPASHTWNELAQVYAASRQVSADQLIEWPAQLKMCGDFKGKRVLDVGCGTGDKTRYFAEHGAASVIGVDPSEGFAQNWCGHAACSNLSFVNGGFENLMELPGVTAGAFDLIVSFQALMYAADLEQTMRTLSGLLAPGGEFVISVPHPFRFAILKNEIEGGATASPIKRPHPTAIRRRGRKMCCWSTPCHASLITSTPSRRLVCASRQWTSRRPLKSSERLRRRRRRGWIATSGF